MPLPPSPFHLPEMMMPGSLRPYAHLHWAEELCERMGLVEEGVVPGVAWREASMRSLSQAA
jgi:hypothetical protein